MEFIEKRGKRTLLRICVVPNSKEYSLSCDEWKDRIKVKIRAQIVKGKANRDLLSYLKKHFKNPKIVRGWRSREKEILIEEGFEDVVKKLGFFNV
ncbi:MAG: DUF167 family protein [Candidatus Methanofastidiosia archaeon]